jgi:hypothetical protein
MVVSISEDATAIISKREFHLRYNRILGGSLPLRYNGLPDRKYCGVVNSVEDIVQYFKHFKAAIVMFVIMAQPMADDAPAIRIGTFASDNKMTSLDVKNRHTYVKKCLKKAGIDVIANGSDGDSREMKFMLEHTGIGMKISDFPKNSERVSFFEIMSSIVM